MRAYFVQITAQCTLPYLTDRRLRENAGENMENIYSKDLLVTTYKVLSLKHMTSIVTNLHTEPVFSNSVHTWRHGVVVSALSQSTKLIDTAPG